MFLDRMSGRTIYCARAWCKRNVSGMASHGQTIDGYVAALPDGVREIFAALRTAILTVVPEADETIKYGMPSWSLRGAHVIYAAAWKNHIGLYPVYRGDAAFEAAVAPYRDKKDTVRLVYNRPVPYDIVTQIVTARRAELEAHS